MNIVEFFELSSGKWFSQRTSHHLAFQQTEAGKSDLQIEMLDKNDPEVVKLCQQYSLDPSLALCGTRITKSGTMEWDKKKQEGSTVLVPILNPESSRQGKLLRSVGNATSVPAPGRYVIGDDDALTLISENEALYSEDRLWFASPNLRLRTSILKQLDGFSTASFCSEIRMGVTAPPDKAS